MQQLIAFVLLIFSPLALAAADHKVGDRVFLRPTAEGRVDGAKVDIGGIRVPATVIEVKRTPRAASERRSCVATASSSFP